MANNDPIQYAAVDFNSQRDFLLQRVKSYWSKSWTDFLNPNSLGRIFVDIAAYSFATVYYLVNRAAAENFLSTMTLRESAVRLGQLVSYRLQGSTAATVLCEANALSPVLSDTVLSKGATIQVSTGSTNLTYELAEDYTILAGSSSPSSLIITVDPTLTAVNVITSFFAVGQGNSYVDLDDKSVDLSQIVSVGFTISNRDQNNAESHVITGIGASPGSVQNNRLFLDGPWTGTVSKIAADITDNRVAFVQGQSNSDSFTSSANLEANQVFSLSLNPVIEASVAVTVNGSAWTVVPTLSTEDSSSESVQIKTLSTGRTAVIFGDGVFGLIPPTNSSIVINYRVGGGSSGNVGTGVINTTIAGYQSTGQVSVQITNVWSAGSGGTDLESLDSARKNIPAYIRTNDRGVTLEDYAALATGFTSGGSSLIKFAKATSGSKNSLLEGNVVKIYGWTTGPNGGLIPIPADIKTLAQQYIQTKAVGTDYIQFIDGQQVPAQVSLRFQTLPNYKVSDVQASVTASIARVASQLVPGGTLSFSSLVEAASTAEGVRSVLFSTPTSDVRPLTETTVLTVPDSTFAYSVDLSLEGNFTYSGHLGFSPVSAWSLNLSVGGQQVLLVPDAFPGIIRIIGNRASNGLGSYDIGLLSDAPLPLPGDYFYATDKSQLYYGKPVGSGAVWVPVSEGGSYIETATGRIVLSFTSTAASAVSYTLPIATGYSSIRKFDVFVSYSGNDSVSTRQKIRASLSTWAQGLKPGSTVFTSQVRGSSGQLLLSASRSNILDVVSVVQGVIKVNQVSLDSPGSSATQINASSTELPAIGSIIINGYSN